MGRRCLFPWCKSSRLLHAFPRDAVRSKLWLRAVGWPSTTNTSKLFVCSKHFSRESYENWRKVDFGLAPEGSLRLSEDAVPRPEDFSIPSKASATCEMGSQTEEPSTKDGQCQTIHDLKQHSWKPELKSERVFYSFLPLSF